VPFGVRMEGLVVGLSVAVGHLEGKAHTVASLARFLNAPRTTVIRALNLRIAAGTVVRRGTRYYLNVERMNSPSAMDTHDKVTRILRKTQRQLLSETDTFNKGGN
jgi:DNA-binding IclR family transcriptional regulator